MANFEVEVTVKNTFIHLEAVRQAVTPVSGRRCHSVPAASRVHGPSADPSAKKAAQPFIEVDSDHARWSDASTVADTSALGSPCSRAQSVDEDAAGKPLFSSRGATCDAEHPEAPPPAPPPEGGSGRGGAWHGRTDAAPSGARFGPTSGAADPSAGAVAAPSAAAPRAASPVSLAELRRQMTAVVTTAVAALAGLGVVRLSGSSEGSRGWSIIAQLRPEDAARRQEALAAAQDALLCSAKGSGSVYVLGHRTQPFVCTPVGFAATLGGIEDETDACWSMIYQGFCRRGSACQWRHPACQTTVNVIVQVERRK